MSGFDVRYFSVRVLASPFKTVFALRPLEIALERQGVAMLLSTLLDQKLQNFRFLLFSHCVFDCFLTDAFFKNRFMVGLRVTGNHFNFVLPS